MHVHLTQIISDLEIILSIYIYIHIFIYSSNYVEFENIFKLTVD